MFGDRKDYLRSVWDEIVRHEGKKTGKVRSISFDLQLGIHQDGSVHHLRWHGTVVFNKVVPHLRLMLLTCMFLPLCVAKAISIS